MGYSLPKNSGYIPDSFDPRDVWLDEILAGSETPLPKEYRTEGLVFEPQGAFPFCAAMSTTKMVEYAVKKETGINYDLSQPHLFFWSGGGPTGSTFRGNLDNARDRGCIPFAKCPMPADLYNTSFSAMKQFALSIPFDSAKKIAGYARVQPTSEALKRAIIDHGMILVGVAASGGWWSDRVKRSKPEDNHACLLVGWDPDGTWWVFDSLQPFKDFSGYHTLHPSYTFNSAYVVTALPDDWKELRDEARVPDPGNVERYGKPRNYEAEVQFAAKMLAEFKRFNNQSVLEAAGRFWEQLIRAGVYGNYSLSYTKWGMWQPGDLINFVYHWRRTSQYLFNRFSNPRSL